MTPRQIRARVNFWLKRLAPLGISHWDVEVTVEDEIDHRPHSDATADTSDQYDTVRLTFRSDKVDTATRPAFEIDQLILHELLHVAMRDFDEVIEFGGREMSSSAKMIWD